MNEKINEKIKNMEDALYHIRVVDFHIYEDTKTMDIEIRFLDGPLKGEYCEMLGMDISDYLEV